MKIKVPQLLWYDNSQLELDFPASWSLSYCPPAGGEAKKLTPAEIQRAFANPIGSSPIHAIAKGKKEVAILFDDLSRPTPAYEIVPYVLKELEKAGIADQQIRFIAALGAHGSQTAIDFQKKLGRDILDRFPVYNHHAFGRCKTIGKTSRGTPVAINEEVMACDLKIGIGCVLPHPFSGFGGGAKIILPGVAHIESITYNHGTILKENPEAVGLGKIEGNIPRLDMEEACRMAGLDIKIDAIVNLHGEITGLYVGDPILEHREATKTAFDAYATDPVSDMDIVVVNAYAKSNESAIALFIGIPALKETGGDMVVICNEPAGQVVHYLFGEFGRCAEEGVNLPQPLPTKIKRIIILSPFRDEVGACLFRKAGNIIWVKTWEEALKLLKEEWGDSAKACLYPDGTMQYLRDRK